MQSCARSPATTNGPPGTSAAAATGCARTCSRLPAALALAAVDLGAPPCCSCWNAGHPPSWPPPRDEQVAFARAGRHGWPERFADRVATRWPPRRCRSATTSSAPRPRNPAGRRPLLAPARPAAAGNAGWASCCSAAPASAATTPQGPRPGERLPRRGDLPELPRPGRPPRRSGRRRDRRTPEQFDTPNALQCYAGRAPVTRRSGKNEFVVARRLAYNRYLGDAVHQWAFCSLNRRPGPASSTTPRSPPATDQSAARSAPLAMVLWHCRTGATQDVPLDPAAAGLALLVVDTGVRHALNDGRYAERRRSCEDAARALGVAALRDLTDRPEAVAGLADPELRRRARHVVSENRRVLAAAELLGRGELAAVGPLLTSSHVSLRDDFEVSWPRADVAVDSAVAAGARRAAGRRRPDDGRRVRRRGDRAGLARARGREVTAAMAEALPARAAAPRRRVMAAVPSTRRAGGSASRPCGRRLPVGAQRHARRRRPRRA